MQRMESTRREFDRRALAGREVTGGDNGLAGMSPNSPCVRYEWPLMFSSSLCTRQNMSDSLYCLLAFEAAPMAPKTRTNPRKPASQKRSRMTVEALIEATARILMRDGYERVSTNRIADAAGVSIGSLYQYFPSKEALVAAVIDRHTQGMMQLIRDALVKVAMRPIE